MQLRDHKLKKNLAREQWEGHCPLSRSLPQQGEEYSLPIPHSHSIVVPVAVASILSSALNPPPKSKSCMCIQ